MLLKLKDIGKIYNSNDILTIGIRNVNLEFDYNEFVTIEGESGSGKSTLLNVIAANDTYEEGELFFNGEPTSHYSKEEWEKYRENDISMIFQDFNIIENLTVYENVMLALLRIEDESLRKKIAKELIEKVGLTKQMNQKGSKLSGGEKQRTVIARALAKDNPIILADEPTGNLDSNSSKEIAKLLKDVSKDKLVIVVTHNPEYFNEYSTRRILVKDGSIVSDNQISKPEKTNIETKEYHISNKLKLKNTLKLGLLNYKSRPKFTTLMSLALCCIAVCLFSILSIFNTYLISDLKTSLDDVGVEGKVIISNTTGYVDEDVLDKIISDTNASYFIYDRDLSEFEITIPRKNNMYKSYQVTCIYDPIHHKVGTKQGQLVIPQSYSSDASKIVDIILGATSTLNNIDVVTSTNDNNLKLYLSYYNMQTNGNKIKGINTTIKIDENETNVYTFEMDEKLNDGEINLINSSYYDVLNKNVVCSIAPSKLFTIVDDTMVDKTVDGIVVALSKNDYTEIFETKSNTKQSALYYESESLAKEAISKLPSGYIGILSSSQVYVENVGQVFALNVLWYACIITISLMLAIILYIIFKRSIKIYASDYAIYKTLGISNDVSNKSLYVQMVLIFIPTLILLPLISLITTNIQSLALPFISVFNYLFIEILILLSVLMVAYGFNKTMAKSKISQVLRRGSK
jgi:putative ABC transport system permease protein